MGSRLVPGSRSRGMGKGQGGVAWTYMLCARACISLLGDACVRVSVCARLVPPQVNGLVDVVCHGVGDPGVDRRIVYQDPVESSAGQLARGSDSARLRTVLWIRVVLIDLGREAEVRASRLEEIAARMCTIEISVDEIRGPTPRSGPLPSSRCDLRQQWGGTRPTTPSPACLG